jgi:hypothetical protein
LGSGIDGRVGLASVCANVPDRVGRRVTGERTASGSQRQALSTLAAFLVGGPRSPAWCRRC